MAARVRQSVGNVDVRPSPSHGLTPSEIVTGLVEPAAREGTRIDSHLDPEAIRAYAETYSHELTASLDADTDDWKRNIPGKPLLGAFGSATGLTPRGFGGCTSGRAQTTSRVHSQTFTCYSTSCPSSHRPPRKPMPNSAQRPNANAAARARTRDADLACSGDL